MQINHIFCDKTGTLTKNQLIFRGIVFCTPGLRDLMDDHNSLESLDLTDSKLSKEIEVIDTLTTLEFLK